MTMVGWGSPPPGVAAPPPQITQVQAGAIVNSGSPTFAQSTTAGNLLVAYVGDNSAAWGITVTGAGWTAIDHSGVSAKWAGMFYKQNCGAGEAPPTFSGGSGNILTQLKEFTHPAGVITFDRKASGAWPVAFPDNDSVSYELVTGVAYFNGQGAHTGGWLYVPWLSDSTTDPNYPYTALPTTLTYGSNSFGDVYLGACHGVAGITGSTPHELVINCNKFSYSGNGVMAAFKPPAAPVPAPPTVQTTTLESASANNVYSRQLVAANGVGPYTWSLVSGTLPAGLSLASSGVISGNGQAGSSVSTFTVQVTDSLSRSATGNVSISTLSPAYQTNLFGAPDPHNSYYIVNADNPQFSFASISGRSNGNSSTSSQPNGYAFINPDAWNAATGKQTAMETTSFAMNQFEIQATITAGGGGAVQCFPNVAVSMGSAASFAWQTGWSHIISSWDEQIDTDPGDFADVMASACFDTWFWNPAHSNEFGVEVMFHFDARRRNADDPSSYFAQKIPFGGYNVTVPSGPNAGTYAIPKFYCNLAVNSNPAAFFNLCDVNGNAINWPVGMIDLYELYMWLVNNWTGLPANTPYSFWSLGYEICDTNSTVRTFRYNNCWVAAF